MFPCQFLPTPFTPLHLGPGLALKALGGRHFSLMVFAGAQVRLGKQSGREWFIGPRASW